MGFYEFEEKGNLNDQFPLISKVEEVLFLLEFSHIGRAFVSASGVLSDDHRN